MRLCSALVLCLAATLTAPLTAAAPSVAAADGGRHADAGRQAAGAGRQVDGDRLTAQPTAECLTAEGDDDFPVTTSIEGEPDTYHPGAAAQRWTVALTNTTETTCDNIHPILVLVDEERTLDPRQPKLEFREGDRWRPVTFEHTDRDENIGVFDDGFPGFTIAPGETVDVPVRLAFAPTTWPHQVVARAALIQRRDDDGDWVGQSKAYPFTITDREASESPSASESEEGGSASESEESGSDQDGDDRTGSRPGAEHPPTQLADTGPGGPPLAVWAWAALSAFLVGAGALVVRTSRFQRR
ncbi:hypothetical protein [Streptomyces apocyni]|uniref:hypothetical protein n=1 Tax=Streptomyces apocyni TaxID=2654677 RepID=UPI0012EA224E|nr:hypothetical protein [Streptomyces apocyni]